MKNTRLQVDFYEQEEASVFLETTSSGRAEEESEVIAVVNFAARQLMNLSASSDRATPNSLAAALQLAAATTLASGAFTYHPVNLVRYPGNPGRKRFVHSVTNDGRVFQSKLKAEGFGFFARGVGYYAPTSCLLVYQYVSGQGKRDAAFRSLLAHAVSALIELRAAPGATPNHLEQTVMAVALAYEAVGMTPAP